VTEISKPNILFILVDSLRADKVFGKNKTSKIPNIESLIKNGVYFEQAICSTPATGVSVSSIFTGLYPFKIGMGSEKYQKFNPKIRSCIQILKENDYNTYATSPEITNDLGVTHDFENPDKSYNNYFSLFAGLGNQIIQKISANYLKKPWFFYIHIFDLHKPVVVPKKFDDEKFGLSQYERMLSATDFWIGKILEKINLSNTLVIFTADHGEYIPLVKHEDKIISLEASATEKNLWKWSRLTSFRKMSSCLRPRAMCVNFQKVPQRWILPMAFTRRWATVALGPKLMAAWCPCGTRWRPATRLKF
jgi:arylsulfatase A-like enzyme